MRFDPVACGSRIKKLRLQRNLTQEQFAEQLNIFYKYVSKIETGSSTASIDLLIDIAGFFDVSMDYLLLGRLPSQENVKNQLQSAISILVAVENAL